MSKQVLYIVCVLLFGLTVGQTETDSPQVDFQVARITDNIRVISCFYGKHWVNVTAFSGPDGVLLIDTGHKRTAQALAERLEQEGLGNITYVINTHHHGDHTGGNLTLGAEATIVAHENVRNRLLDGIADSLVATVPSRTFTDSMTLFINGDTLKLIHLPNGHTDGDIIVHFTGANVVCIGDLLFSDALPHVFRHHGGSIDGFIANLDTVLERFPADVTLIAGHGRPYSMIELRRYRDMLSSLTDSIRIKFQAGMEMDDVFAADVLNPWRDWVSTEFVSDSAFVLIVWDNDAIR